MQSSKVKPSIQSYFDQSIKQINRRVLLLSAIVLLPIYIFLVFLYEYNQVSKILQTATPEIAQQITMGDIIGVKRSTHSLILGQQFVAAKIYAKDGTCTSVATLSEIEKPDSFNTKINTSCEETTVETGIKYSYPILSAGSGEVGKIVVWISFPWVLALIAPFFIGCLAWVLNMLFRASIKKVMSNLVHTIEDLPNIFGDGEREFELQEFDQVSQEIKRLQKRELELAASKVYSDVAVQVAHDIRSPLSALELMSSQLTEVPETKRLVVRNSINRIRDIANSLSLKGEQGISYQELSSSVRPVMDSDEVTLLLPVLDMIVTEKRIENREKLNVSINFEQSQNSYGLFARIEPKIFKRLLSNLINNAVEALPNESGKIEIFLKEGESGKILVQIVDNGKGIPEDLLPKLGIRGNTFNKEGGSGLGLAHAKEALEEFGGELQISSEINIGTMVTIKLPKEKSPDWFVPKLVIKSNTKILTFDDDLTVHQVWRERFDSVNKNIELIRFSNVLELRKFFSVHFADLDDTLFLMDYEILNQNVTGLDLIEDLGIQKQAVLVTSRFEETGIRKRCEIQKVKLIPKSMSAFVPIEIT